MKHGRKIVFILFLSAVAALSGCATTSPDSAGFSKLTKGEPIYIEKAKLNLTVSRVGGDKSKKYVSEAELNRAFRDALTKALSDKGLLADNEDAAQASLDITVGFERTFLIFTDRRMNPIVNFVIEAHKGKHKLARYASGQFTNSRGLYNNHTDADELAVAAFFGHKVAERIEKMEHGTP